MSAAREQRLQYRFPVEDAEPLRGLIGEGSVRSEVKVVDLSLGGAGLVLPNLPRFRGRTPLRLGLETPSQLLGDTPIDLVHVRNMAKPSTGGSLLGVRFSAPGEQLLQSLCHYLIERHSQSAERPHFVSNPVSFTHVTDPTRLRRLLDICCRTSRSLQVYEPSGRPVAYFVVSSLEPHRLLGELIPIGGCCLREGTPYHIVLQSFAGLHLFFVPLLGRLGSRVIFAAPKEMLAGGIRRLGRLDPEEEFNVTLEFLHPQIPGKVLRKKAREVGLGGLSFSLSVQDDLLAPGSVLDSAILRLPEGRSLPCTCQVRHTYRDASGRYSCGVELTHFKGRGRELWVSRVLERMNPNMEEATPFTLEDVWDTFDRSGYLNEKPRERLVALKAPFFDTWQRLMHTRGGSRCWIYRSDSEPIGTISTSRIYSNAWLIHHLAAQLDRLRNPRHKLLVIADLAPRTVLQWIGGIAPEGTILTYLDAEKPFNKWAWFDFFEAHQGEHLDSRRVALWDIVLSRTSAPPVPAEVWVRPALVEELRPLSLDLKRRDGALVSRAFDYALEQLLLDQLREDPEGQALGRKRVVLVSGFGKETAGYALVEWGAAGLNIFSLYDTCRILLSDHLPQDLLLAVRDALFAAAVEHFRAQGCESFLYLTGSGDAPPPERQDAFCAHSYRAVIGVSLVPVWVEFLIDILGPK